MTEQQKRTLADYIHELADTHHHSEVVELAARDIDGHRIRRQGPPSIRHTVETPSLLVQLWANDTPSASVEEGLRPGFASKPAARLDALDTAVHIDLAVNRWILDLGEQPRHLDTVDALHQLHGLAASADAVTRKKLEKDAKRWWMRARIVTGWDSPAWTPDNTCPQCGERGTLRIRLADRIGLCTFKDDTGAGRECEATWDEASIGVLAEHIRAESESERMPRLGGGPCWCPYPKPAVPDLRFLCPGCGSARCRHALGVRLLATIRASQAEGQVGA